ncbi:hypothetical protein [Burkholderia multivorans]|uniref:hypothetical protein n=1 Tax=Burkholderia multivorans TaxID=87883 RepID=UPI000CFF506A|nr:hypothetical protein [Burkholderia multivorans]MBH9662136.1 hypothetical protein [Burkholderia multivorans]MBU9650214.1 hypothetical protein [Burkholderia multivorans]PRG16943.1 hypothetical protein C6T62_29560 [Burkholderia multivorans]
METQRPLQSSDGLIAQLGDTRITARKTAAERLSKSTAPLTRLRAMFRKEDEITDARGPK